MSSLSPYRFRDGFRDGIAIGIGYFSVSFGFGISAVGEGIRVLEALLISMTCVTSAGQVAGVAVIASAGTLIEMILTQLVINLRYSLMGMALSQHTDPRCTTPHRLLMSFGITDEVFAVASSKPAPICPRYFYGLFAAPYLGWALGTLCGALAGQILPEQLRAALGIMIYAMFIAIILPPMKKKFAVLLTVLLAAAMSCAIHYIPLFDFISEGFSIIISGVLSALFVSFFCPIREEEDKDAPDADGEGGARV